MCHSRCYRHPRRTDYIGPLQSATRDYSFLVENGSSRAPARFMKRGPKFVATLVSIALVAVMAALDQTVVATALPHMIADLQGATLLGWIFTAYFLAATATVTVAGKLGDLFGRRGGFITPLGLFLV